MDCTFKIDLANSDDQNLYVDIPGRASVCILVNERGVSVKVYSANVSDSPAAACSTNWERLMSDH